MTQINVTTVARAEELLAEWGAVYADRDARVLLAWRSRVPKTRIAQLTGIARSTVDAIIKAAQNPLG